MLLDGLKGCVRIQAEPEPNSADPTHCYQQLIAQQISTTVGQVTAAARQSVYGQAAADATNHCNPPI